MRNGMTYTPKPKRLAAVEEVVRSFPGLSADEVAEELHISPGWARRLLLAIPGLTFTPTGANGENRWFPNPENP